MNVYKVDEDQIVSNAIINNFVVALSREVRQMTSSGSGSGSGSGIASGDGTAFGGIPLTRRSTDSGRFATGAISLVGITTNGNEGITWDDKIISGTAIIDYNPGTDYVGAVEVTLTSEECTVLLNCSSIKGQDYSCITLTTGKHISSDMWSIIVVICLSYKKEKGLVSLLKVGGMHVGLVSGIFN